MSVSTISFNTLFRSTNIERQSENLCAVLRHEKHKLKNHYTVFVDTADYEKLSRTLKRKRIAHTIHHNDNGQVTVEKVAGRRFLCL